MTQIQLHLSEDIHATILNLVSPMAPEKEPSGNKKGINIWMPVKVNDVITHQSQKYGFSKSELIEMLLASFSKVAAKGLSKSELQELAIAAKKITFETRNVEKRYKIGLTKATMIPAILQRIIDTSNIEEFCILNVKNKQV